MLQRGTLSKVNEIIAGLDDKLRPEAEVEWNYGDNFERGSQFIADLAKAMGWTPDWLDAEWRKAAKLYEGD